MAVYEVDPRLDARWTALVESHPDSSVFHTVDWLNALERTYRYTPRVFTTTPPGSPLLNGIAFCQVDSWLTGSRLVSLPFSDHCEPLIHGDEDLPELLSHIASQTAGKLRYSEIRPRMMEMSVPNFRVTGRFSFHALDLEPGIDELYSHLHKDSIQRKIQRAGREGVVVEEGRSEQLLNQYYGLLMLTRRRHGVPPQPYRWFRNLTECFGPRLTIYVARLRDRPIASILTLRHKKSIVYKYGCSDAHFHNAGGMPQLFWHVIQQAKSEERTEMDLGRSEEDNPGLIQFKNRLGAKCTTISYWRRSSRVSTESSNQQQNHLRSKVLSRLPDILFRLSGEIFYRHAG